MISPLKLKVGEQRMQNVYDLIVVGLGAMGSATLYQAAKTGAKVLGIDRYNPPHEFGSSHAETRITRLAVGEGPQYLPFVERSHEIWHELEAQTGRRLLYQPGLYVIAPKDASRTGGGHWDRFVRLSYQTPDLFPFGHPRHHPQGSSLMY